MIWWNDCGSWMPAWGAMQQPPSARGAIRDIPGDALPDPRDGVPVDLRGGQALQGGTIDGLPCHRQWQNGVHRDGPQQAYTSRGGWGDLSIQEGRREGAEMSRIDIPKIVAEELQLSSDRGFQSEIINGGRHFKVFVCGRLAGVLSRGKNWNNDQRSAQNLRSNIRRIVKEQSSAQK